MEKECAMYIHRFVYAIEIGPQQWIGLHVFPSFFKETSAETVVNAPPHTQPIVFRAIG
jgi:hypothetical protein